MRYMMKKGYNMYGLYQGIIFKIYEFDSVRYHIEPICIEDMDKCINTKWVEYQMHWYATVFKKDVQIIE